MSAGGEAVLDLAQAAHAIVAYVRRRMAGSSAPLLVALDGGSGAGKSTLAAMVAPALGATLVPGDDFYAADIPDAEWERRSAAQRAADAIDWRRLRAEALEPLLERRPARWHAFDFAGGARPDGTYAMLPYAERRDPADVIVLDGAYSARPELADLIDVSVLVDVPLAVRHARLAAREDAAFLAAWHARWDAAEAHYFACVRPPPAFDLVLRLG